MSALLNTLPGDIPGLLRSHSSVIVAGETQSVRGLEYASDETLYIRLFGWGRPFHGSEVALDLTDPTGRAHAAWWLMDRWRSGPRLPVEDRGLVLDACRFAEQGADMTSEQIDTFARLVLRLVGRTS